MSSHEHEHNGFPTLTSPGTLPVLDNIFQVSDKFLGQLKLWLEQHPPSTPITSILGFQQFTAQSASTIDTNQGTTSSTYGDLATVGPTLTGLPDGKYLFVYGSVAVGVAATTAAIQSIQVNSTTAVDADACQNSGSSQCSISMASIKTLSNAGNNTVACKYRSSDNVNTSSFARRWLIALRYANP